MIRFKKRNKYRNEEVRCGGETFDSVKERDRYNQLLLLQRAGKISGLRRQVEFELIPTRREPDTIGPRGAVHPGKVIEKKCSYYADFVYTEGGKTVVEDTKGFRTADYIIKRKLMLHVHGIRIKEI